jgi:hypothetical protein
MADDKNSARFPLLGALCLCGVVGMISGFLGGLFGTLIHDRAGESDVNGVAAFTLGRDNQAAGSQELQGGRGTRQFIPALWAPGPGERGYSKYRVAMVDDLVERVLEPGMEQHVVVRLMGVALIGHSYVEAHRSQLTESSYVLDDYGSRVVLTWDSNGLLSMYSIFWEAPPVIRTEVWFSEEDE